MSSPVFADRSATVFKTPTTSSRCSTQGGAWTADGRTATTTPAAARTPRRPIAGEFRTPRSRKRTPGGDRFIPSRSGADLQFSAYTIRSAKRRRLTDGSSETCRAENGSGLARTPLAADPDSARRREKLFALKGRSSESRVLNIKQITATSGTNHNDAYWKDYNLPTPNSTSARKAVRKYPKTADKILDAPNLIDDFYLNVMDWSQRGTLAIALGSVVYLLDAETSDSSSLCSTSSENNYVSSLQWNKTGQYLAVGDSNADIQLWDVDAKKLVRTMRTHDSRVNALAWNPRTHLLSSASQSGNIHNYDVRQPRFHVGSVDGRSRDICGLRWSPSGRFLASGGDGNLVCLWDTHSRDPWTSPSHVLREHTAAVKALSWCPWQPNLLASGGGSADQNICLWNACTGQLLDKIHTGSQVSGLVWSSQHRELLSSHSHPHNELLSSHGHPHNELLIWSYPSLSRAASLRGHQGRILHLAPSHDGNSVASAGADETLRFWKCFATAPGSQPTTKGPDRGRNHLLRPEPLEMPGYIL